MQVGQYRSTDPVIQPNLTLSIHSRCWAIWRGPRSHTTDVAQSILHLGSSKHLNFLPVRLHARVSKSVSRKNTTRPMLPRYRTIWRGLRPKMADVAGSLAWAQSCLIMSSPLHLKFSLRVFVSRFEKSANPWRHQIARGQAYHQAN